MKINIDISDEYEEPVMTIHAKEWTRELESIVKFSKGSRVKRLVGEKGGQSFIIQAEDIDYVQAEGRKVTAVLKDQIIELKMKLYEVEETLDQRQFTRFSKSVIGNVDQIHRFELSFNGNLCVYFKSGNKEYVSRKYTKVVHETLRTGGK
ncbi:LytTR family DNA-binding domain-containing protein [Domibacillus epiphyticus]|uniref:LytTR family transcriptional regulator n=1 Tax=Domibacillus epiphyticus TaxID=1714355 RepID=A0A1V2AA20_9BACI|nr:LytTR family DNA-binding domain-containing protein [Domibacillus epiphyticus]OMP67831.1 LytTR family transcriptional regulator [Domibacillus epiphyticus]